MAGNDDIKNLPLRRPGPGRVTQRYLEEQAKLRRAKGGPGGHEIRPRGGTERGEYDWGKRQKSKKRPPGQPRAVGKEARAHKAGRGQPRQMQSGRLLRRARTLTTKAMKGRGALEAVFKGKGPIPTAKEGLQREAKNVVRNVYSKGPSPGLSRLSKLAEKLGKGMKVFTPYSVLKGAADWKAQGGPSATELLGIKKYKRPPKVKYGGQQM